MNDTDRLLMSDALKGKLPELDEEIIKKLEDTIITVSFQFSREDVTDVMSGLLVGCSVDSDSIKLDFRLDTTEAYNWFAKFVEPDWRCIRLIIEHAGHCIDMTGPFYVNSPKIIDIDRQSKMSTLGIDLIRN